jgi:hypothetical protein
LGSRVPSDSEVEGEGAGDAGEGSSGGVLEGLRRGDHLRMVLGTDESTPEVEAAKKRLMAAGGDNETKEVWRCIGTMHASIMYSYP